MLTAKQLLILLIDTKVELQRVVVTSGRQSYDDQMISLQLKWSLGKLLLRIEDSIRKLMSSQHQILCEEPVTRLHHSRSANSLQAIDKANQKSWKQAHNNNPVAVDFYILNYNFTKGCYEVLGKTNNKFQKQREAQMDLLLYGRKPIRIKQQKEAPSNLTVHVLPPKFHSPDGYLFLFETISKHIEDKKAYLVTTMYCFLTPQFRMRQLRQIMYKIMRIACLVEPKLLLPLIQMELFQLRQRQIDFKADIDEYLTFCIREPMNMVYYPQFTISAIAALLYSAITERSVVLLASFQSANLISHLLTSLYFSLKPLSYVYSIIYASLVSQHEVFLDIPCTKTIGYFGQQIALDSVRKKGHEHNKKISKDICDQSRSVQLVPELPWTIIDLNRNEIELLSDNGSDMNAQDCCLLIALNYFLHENTDMLFTRQLLGLTDDLLSMKQTGKNWKSKLQEILFKSQMFAYYKDQHVEQL